MLKTLESFLERIEKTALIVLFCTMLGLSFVQVILRAGFSTGLLWADVFLRHLVLWVGFLGAVLAVNQKKHFAMDVLVHFFPRKLQCAIEVLADLFAIFVLYYLCVGAVNFFKDDAQSGSILFGIGAFQMPSAWMNVIIPAAFILMAVHFAFKTLEDLSRLFGAGKPQNQA